MRMWNVPERIISVTEQIVTDQNTSAEDIWKRKRGNKVSNTCCFECRHYLTDCCNNPESDNYGLEVDLFDGCEEGECEDDG